MYFYAAIEGRVRLESDCEVDPQTMQFNVNISRGVNPLVHSYFNLKCGFSCYDSLGEMV